MSTSDLSLEVEAQAPVERFRKRPLEVETLLWDGTMERLAQIKAWVGVKSTPGGGFVSGFVLFNQTEGLRIWNDQEQQYISYPVGHRVVRGKLDEYYPISPEAVAETYEVAPEPLELTLVEQAAAARSEHMSHCHEEACVKCMRELRFIRRIVKAVRPHIEEQVREGERQKALLDAEVLDEVAAERIAQDERWGEQNHRDGTDESMRPYADEARHQCQYASLSGHVTWRLILAEEVAEVNAESDPAKLRAELLQVAAVAVAWAEAIDRRSAPVAAASNPTPIPDGEA